MPAMNPMMESTGGAFSPRSTRSQTPMAPQQRFNMTPGLMTPGSMPQSKLGAMRPPTTPQPGMRSARTIGA